MVWVNIDLKDFESVYKILCVEGIKVMKLFDDGEDDVDLKLWVYILFVVVFMGKMVDFVIEFNFFLVGCLLGEIRLLVMDNFYEESIV